MHKYIVSKRKETDDMALEFAKELLGDAYTGELEEKLEAKINELYAPKADLDAASVLRWGRSLGACRRPAGAAGRCQRGHR